MDDLEQLFADMEALLERIISQQRDKVMAVALDILPHCSRRRSRIRKIIPKSLRTPCSTMRTVC